jgi:hypothetical protein
MMGSMSKVFIGIVVVIVIVLGVGAYFGGWFQSGEKNTHIQVATTFEECVSLGFPVAESYPRQCTDGSGNHFTEFVGNELEKRDLIRLSSPRPNMTIGSPLTISGEARGYWYFEASFPVILTDWDGKIIASHYATAQGEWMTEDFVPFTSNLTFESPYKEGDPDFMKRGTLILAKDNPSGLPEHDDALEIPVIFE